MHGVVAVDENAVEGDGVGTSAEVANGERALIPFIPQMDRSKCLSKSWIMSLSSRGIITNSALQGFSI